MIFYVENPMKPKKRNLELMNYFSKAIGYNANLKRNQC